MVHRNEAVFPVWESPSRCYITSVQDDVSLSCPGKNGIIGASKQKGVNEEWCFILASQIKPEKGHTLDFSSTTSIDASEHSSETSASTSTNTTPTPSSNGSMYFYIVSTAHKGQFLSASPVDDGDVNVCTVTFDESDQPGDSELWRIEPCVVQQDEETTVHAYKLVSRAHRKCPLGLNGNIVDISGMLIADAKSVIMKEWDTAWKFEFLTGELCFVKNAATNQHICLDSHAQTLSLTSRFYVDWEVWRFAEVGDGRVLISSWTDPHKYLSGKLGGEVSFSFDAVDERALWIMEKHTKGVIFRSSIYTKRVLYTNGDRLEMIEENNLEQNLRHVWQMEPINRNIFYISIPAHNRRLSYNEHNGMLGASENRKQAEQWKVFSDPLSGSKGAVSLQHVRTKLWLATNEENLYLSETNRDDASQWILKTSPVGGIQLASLADPSEKLCHDGASLYASNDFNEDVMSQTWQFEPVLPSTLEEECKPRLPVVGPLHFAQAVQRSVHEDAGTSSFNKMTSNGMAAKGLATSMMCADVIANANNTAALTSGLIGRLQEHPDLGNLLGGSIVLNGGAVLGGTLVGNNMTVISAGMKKCGTSNSAAGYMIAQQHEQRPICGWKTW